MKGNVIPDSDIVSRYCSFGKLSETDRPTKAAFELSDSDREDDNPHLSVNWLDYFKGKSREEQISEVRSAFVDKGYKLGGNAKFALVKVSEIHEKTREAGVNVRVLHWPDGTDKSHSGIFDVENDPDVIALKLSQMNCEMVPAKAA